jgi:uncharacterized protein YfbU (UPF0304 family)
MKQMIAILLSMQILLGSLFPNVDTTQLAKIGELIKHYQEHVATENQDLSFVDFLIMHYSSDSNHTKTAKHSHSNLPHLDSHHVVIAYCEPVFKSIIPSSSNVLRSFPEPNFAWQNLYHFSLSQTLLNPPKSC